MNKNTTNQLLRGISILAVAALTACGGGGDDGSHAPAPIPAPATAPTPIANSDLLALSPSNYPTGSPQEYMFNQLNDARMKCGFGALRHDTRLDSSALNHANFLAQNNLTGHFESKDYKGFTGNHPYDRMAFVTYNAYAEKDFVGSTISSFQAAEGITYSSLETADRYKLHIPGQLSVVYHSIGALRPYRDIGFAIAKRSSYKYSPGTVIIHNLGSESASQKLAAGEVSTYPCDGVQNLWTFHGNESPNPLTGRDLRASPPGHPVMIISRWGSKLSEIQVTMQHATTGANLELAAVRTMDNDTSGLLLRNEAFAIPSVQLEKSSNYKVRVTGKVDGVTFEKNFTFSTGTVNAAAVASGRYE